VQPIAQILKKTYFSILNDRFNLGCMQKEVTIYDLANALNVSAATISRGLQNNKRISKATRKKILDKAEEMGYRHNNFASSLRKQKSHTIGILVHELNSHFMTSVLAGIEQISTEAGYDLIIAHSSEKYSKEAANARNLFHKRVDGLIASLSFETMDLDHFQPYFDKGIPVIFFDRVEEHTHMPKVIIDNYQCGYQATQHLIEQGCKRIALVTANLNRNVYAQRYKGYRDALSDHTIAHHEAFVLIKDLSEKCGREAALEIMKMKPMPDGAFITNDFSAAVFMQTLKENGIRIPQDIAVVGFNNDAISKLVEPKLTTINYPGMEVGAIAASHLIAQLKGEGKLTHHHTIMVQSALIVRESSLKKGK
jgi:LacI family transcriptional regulator